MTVVGGIPSGQSGVLQSIVGTIGSVADSTDWLDRVEGVVGTDIGNEGVVWIGGGNWEDQI